MIFKISKALENLNNNRDIHRAWENSKENIKSSATESLHLRIEAAQNHGFTKND